MKRLVVHVSHGTTTFRIKTLSITTFSIPTLRTKGLFVPLSINAIQHDKSAILLSVFFFMLYFFTVMLNVIMLGVIVLSVVMLNVVAPLTLLNQMTSFQSVSSHEIRNDILTNL
jgi:hypothetical protein